MSQHVTQSIRSKVQQQPVPCSFEIPIKHLHNILQNHWRHKLKRIYHPPQAHQYFGNYQHTFESFGTMVAV